MKYALVIVFGFWTIFFSSWIVAADFPGEAPAVQEFAQFNFSNTKSFLSLEPNQGDWTFSGIVSNEVGEKYQFYLEIQRDNQYLQGFAILINGASKEVILYEESEGQIDGTESNALRVGRIFLKFNPINNSWIFGVKAKDKKGFNFKVDMMEIANSSARQHNLRKGLELLINQTGLLNGHFQAGEANKEQFVTAPRAWFRQVWASKPQAVTYPVVGILCQFNDGSGFYSVNASEINTPKATISGWRNEHGQPISVPQGITVKEEKTGNWSIQIPSSKMKLSLDDILPQYESHHLIVGLIDGSTPGFCALRQEKMNEDAIEKTS